MARQLEQEVHERFTSQITNNDNVGRSISTWVSSQETVEIIASAISELREDVEVNGVNEEMRLQEFLLGRASSTSSEGAYRDQAKQKTLLQPCVKSKAGADDSMALHLSMDIALASEDTLVTGAQTRNFRKIVRSHKHPSIISIKKKNGTNDTLYHQALQNVNDALAPPVPNSKIREYQLDDPPFFVSNDIANLHEVAACDLSGDDGKVLVFDSDTDHSGNHTEEAAFHSAQKQKKYLNDRNDGDSVFINFGKKRSPTSITNFFGDPLPMEEKSRSGVINGEDVVPFLLRHEDDFLPIGLDWTTSLHDRFYEEQGYFVLPSSRSPPGKYRGR